MNNDPLKSQEAQFSAPDEPESLGTGESKSDSSAEWNTHEHQSERARMQAQELVRETGSSELAKHVIDEVAHHVEPAADQTAFARQFGFESYLAMFEASTPLTSYDGHHWLITTTANGQWIAWNENDLGAVQRFRSLEEASRLFGAEASR